MKKPNAEVFPAVRGFFIVLAAAWILVSSGAALPYSGHQEPGDDSRNDLAQTRQDILRFEDAVNDVISSSFSSSPFAMVQKPKGAYLPDYGISVSFMINIHRAVINTPFGQVRSKADVSPENKKRRVDELKEKLIRALLENGDNFRQLRKEDNVTIVGFIEDRNFPDEPNANRTIVMKMLKKDLDEFGHKTERYKEFRQRVKILEY
jgi:hypothetical protein